MADDTTTTAPARNDDRASRSGRKQIYADQVEKCQPILFRRLRQAQADEFGEHDGGFQQHAARPLLSDLPLVEIRRGRNPKPRTHRSRIDDVPILAFASDHGVSPSRR